ncbi:hypothetical protein CK218_24640 [Mesorhizobium sp. WSM3879]|uniref:hypothetical protein n=1 Tax=Mesorhizobium sp. WSM4887 TaxID=3038543 RepID=UPI000832DE29|nr:hypothetical protein [Mesorhizobium sp. WSM4887]MDG4887510.1 hypothetical protein [Mesorhizobium sp. WSM4887]PBB78539.1 hypothetical protein CK218_24640 [Mesorhizobium sp. WSM3879]RWM92456.1 MAG: hypothetical protein EOR86_22920 [Mesorhizobium sp.]TIS69275.1 MAG: hypothetical protein E5X11_07325 [Mesorhizobium sp.]
MKTSNIQIAQLPASSQQQGDWKINVLFDRTPKGATSFGESAQTKEPLERRGAWALEEDRRAIYGEKEASHLAAAGSGPVEQSRTTSRSGIP